MAVKLAMLKTLERLEQEMEQAGRSDEQQALHEAINALARPPRGFLTTGQAAERLGISIPTVKRWIERGTLNGGPVGGRWLVAVESVERIVKIRQLFKELDEEGYPSDEEIREMYSKRRVSPAG